MNDEEVEVTFRFPREALENAFFFNTVEEYLGQGRRTQGAERITNLFYAQVLEWRETQKYVVTVDTPAGADVIYTDERGEEHPAVLVVHRRNAEALIWFSHRGYSLSRAPLERLRLAEGGGQ